MKMPARKPYDCDLTDAEWALIRPLLPPHPPWGHDPVVSRREMINAIFYVHKHGCTGRGLPHDFPKWQTVYGYFRQCGRTGGGDRRQPIGENDRKRGVHGYDAGKKVNGRKRHILVDTLGLLLAVVVHSADIQDREGVKSLFFKAAPLFPTVSLVWVDGGYSGQLLLDWLKRWCGWVLEIVHKLEGQVGFQLLPRRWVVERTFAWLGHSRRLSKNYEELVENSEAMVQIAMIRLMLQRICRPSKPQKR